MTNRSLTETTTERVPSQSMAPAPIWNESAPGVDSFHHVVELMFRFRWRSICFFVLSLTTVSVSLYYWPREYASEAKLYVRAGRGADVTLDPTVVKGPPGTLHTAREAQINSALELISSRTIYEKLIDAIGSDVPFETPLARDKAIVKLAKRLTIWSPEKSNVICISCKAKTPEKAQEIVAKLVEIFLAENLRVHATPGSFEFFEEQAESAKTRLDAATVELQTTKSEYSLASVAGRRTTLEGQIGVLEQKMKDNETALLVTETRISVLKGELDDLPKEFLNQYVEGLPVESTNSTRQQLFNLQKREQELSSKYAEGHPELIKIRSQIEEAEKIVTGGQPNRSQATSGALLNEMVDQKGRLAERDSLREHYQDIQAELKTLNQQELRIVELERSIGILEGKYQKYLHNLEEARIDRELERSELSNISVIQDASLRLKPVSPNKAITLILGFLVAMLGALSLPFLSDQLDTTLRSSDEIEQCMHAPVLLVMPRRKKRRGLVSI